MSVDAYAEEELDAAAAFARAVAGAAYDLRVREAARAKVAAEKIADVPGFDAGTLAEVLARDPEPAHRAEGLIPWAASTLIVAQRKTGKTTLTLNLARALIEGGDFLGRFPVKPVAGRVALLNFEVSAAMVAGWAAEAGVDPDRFVLVNLRGRRNPLRDPEDRAKLAALLREHAVESLIVDPFGRAFTGASQNDAAEVGAFLVDLDTFARAEAGVTDLILTAHAGWGGERTRGSSALEDWPDVVITMTRDAEDSTKRYLSAEGRDVLLEEDRLEFDASTRLLSLAGAGSRKQARAQQKVAELGAVIAEVVSEKPGINTSGIEKALRDRDVGFQRGDVGNAARQLVHSSHLRSQHGPRNSVLWFPRLAVLPSTPDYSPREAGSTPDPSYGVGSTPLPFEGSVLPDEEERPSRAMEGGR